MTDELSEQHMAVLEALFDRVPVGIAIFDRDLVLRRCNPTWATYIARHTNTPVDAVLPGARFIDLAPGTETTSLPRYQRALSGETVREEGVVMRSNGNESYWDVTLSPLVSNGQVVGVVDVTASATERFLALREAREQRDSLEQIVGERTADLVAANTRLVAEAREREKAEQALREERNFISAVMDTAGALVIVVDREGRIVRFNRGCEHVTGYSFAEVRNRRFWEVLIPPEEAESLKHGFHGLLGGDTPADNEVRWFTKSGEQRVIVWSTAVIPDENGAMKYLIGTGIDITDRQAAETALRESEEKYRDLVENANSIIMRLDTRGRVTFFNEFAQQFFGYSADEIVGREALGTIVPVTDEEGHDLGQLIADISREPEQYKAHENENVRRNGERVWVAWTNRTILDEQGQTREILCVGNDITEQRHAAESLRQAHENLESRVEERTAQLKLANEVLQREVAERERMEKALRERAAFENLVTTISTSFINLSSADLDAGVNQALKAIGEFAGVDRSYVFQYSEDQRYASNTHEWCAPGVTPEIQNLQKIDVYGATPQWTAKQLAGETIHIPVVAELPDSWRLEREILQFQGIISVLSVPIVKGGKTVGFLGFDSVRAQKTWSEESVKLLRIVGEIFVNAFERTKAERQVQQAYQTLEERVEDRTRELYTLLAVQQAISSRLDPDAMLQMVADEARRLTGSQMAIVFLKDSGELMRLSVVSGDADRSLLGATVPIDGSLTGLAVRTGKPQSSADARSDPRPDARMVRRVGARNMLVVPLIYGTHAIGGIVVANKSGGVYGPEDERRLAMLASGAAVDLENAHLYREEQERRLEADQRRQVAEGLRDILAILNTNRSLQEVLDYIVARACRIMGTDAGALFRLEADGEMLAIQASQGLSPQFVRDVKIPLGLGAVGEVALTRRPIAMHGIPRSLAEDPHYFSGERRRQIERLASRYKSLLAVPLVVKDEVYGGIVLYYPEEREFSDDEVALAATFGDQAALAMENARLRARAEEAAVAAERSRLARDLHDAVTQTLFSSSLIAEVLPRLWERNPDEGRRRLEELRQLTRGALAEMRTLLLELRPSAVTEAALPDLLRQLAEALTGRARVPATVKVEGERPLESDVQIALYRIAQEALNNVAKHSGASQAKIDLRQDDAGVELRIEDDGRGFDPGQVGPDHLGLDIMRERAEAIGATVEVSSMAGSGTRVVAVWRDTGQAGKPRVRSGKRESRRNHLGRFD